MAITAPPSLLALAAALLLAPPAGAQQISRYDPGAPRARPADPAPSPTSAQPVPEPDISSAPDTLDDPLARNGLGGALCRSRSLAGGLSPAARSDCALAGSVAAQAPVGHYGFDVHIDTGALGVGANGLLSAVQTLVLTPLWTALLWLTHAVLSIVEWSFAIDPLDDATMGGVARGLADVRRTVTEPWLALALCVAAVGLLHHALVRRRVTESLSGALAMAAMMLAGLWIIGDPAGTVGQVNRTVNQAGLGTVAAISSGDPTQGPAALGDGLRAVFADAVVGPWCYLEFGDVDWCRNPARRDPRLVKAAEHLRTKLLKDAQCDGGECAAANRAHDRAALLGRAQTNGELFLAFPANGGERNSISDERSLYRVLCATDDDNHCTGAGAQQAAWRTESGTWPRAGGLLLITGGVIGMLALLGFIALRLLGAAILTIVFLLLTPIAVLAPALGEGGRASFRAWAERLLGALLGKLIYAVLLGVVLVVLRILEALGTAGWWTQWLLVASFWWIVFLHRHQVVAYARLGHPDHGARGLRVASNLLAARQVTQMTAGAIAPRRGAVASAASGGVGVVRRGREGVRNARAERRLAVAEAERERALRTRVGQADGTLEHEQRDARAIVQDTPRQQAELAALTAQRARVGRAGQSAHEAGDRQRGARLSVREAALTREIEQRRARMGRAQADVERADRARQETGHPRTPAERQQRAMLLDAQAQLRRGAPPGPRADPTAYRDYARLAGLAGVSPHEYERQAPAQQLRTRAAVDRAFKQRPAPPEAPPAEEDVSPRRVSREPRIETDHDRRRRQFGVRGVAEGD